MDIPPPHIPFKLSRTGITYFGIWVTISTDSESRFYNLNNWNKTGPEEMEPLTDLSNIQIVKMNILPRYLYLFHCLPIFLPRSFFNPINSCISSFIWAGKHASPCFREIGLRLALGCQASWNIIGYSKTSSLLWTTSIRGFTDYSFSWFPPRSSFLR